MRVVACCTYVTDVEIPWRGVDHDAHDYVHAVKGKQLNGYVWLRLRGRLVRITNANRETAIEVFAEQGAALYQEHFPYARPVFVPIPNSGSDLGGPVPNTYILAALLAAEVGDEAEAIDLFRWSEPHDPAHAGGTRDREQIFGALRMLEVPLPDGDYVLVDDVLTSGAHMQACAAALQQMGREPVGALVVGRAEKGVRVDAPMAPRVIDVEPWAPAAPSPHF